MKKPSPPTPRNPVARDLITDPKYRKKVAKSTKEKAEKRDGWNRDAKHKKFDSLEEASLSHGDNVEIISGPLMKVLARAEQLRKKKAEEADETVEAKPEEKSEKKKLDYKAVVKQPDGPANTVGISLDGEYHLVDEDDVRLITEAFDDLLEMRYVETTAGLRVPVSGEEQEIFDKAGDKLYKKTLDEREKEVARKMVSRGVLNRRQDDDGSLYFVKNSKKLTRF
jgi:hypothetical protein